MEKKLIRQTERRLRMYQLIQINIRNLEDDIEKLRSQKESVSGGLIQIKTTAPDHSDNFRLAAIESAIEKKQDLRERLRTEFEEIERAIDQIRHDEYFFVIDCYYLKCQTIQNILDNSFISRSTFFSVRNRLLKRLGLFLYPELVLDFC